LKFFSFWIYRYTPSHKSFALIFKCELIRRVCGLFIKFVSIFLQQFNNVESPGFVGFANLPNQVHRKSVKKGFEFTLMVVGESGLGKSTLVNSLFLTDLYPERTIPDAIGVYLIFNSHFIIFCIPIYF